ncbi:MAG: hypothetical protein ACRDP3_14905 [Streptomyces sp.]|uniref:hypothetical protein n=1 Tax=Streptomyces sp. TaxID=1931 RepID=UPI003D6AF6B7
MATDTTKTEQTEETGTGAGTDDAVKTDKKTDVEKTTTVTTATVPKQDKDADERPAGADADGADDDDDILVSVTEEREAYLNGGGRGWAAGAAAVVTAGLGLSSLIGTSLSEMLRDRMQLIGQIESSAQQQGGGGGGADQINALYGAPWHATALVNGVFALLAVVVGGALLAMVTKQAETRSWVKGVALGGVILGVLGLLVAGGMYLDLFASAPKVPAAPAPPS